MRGYVCAFLFAALLVVLSTYATNDVAIEPNEIKTMTMPAQQYVVIEDGSLPKMDTDGELGIQMNRGGYSPATTGTYKLSAGTSGDKEEEHLMI